jgi:ABC-type transport system involved in cytochrome c biogenesis ATPase subunit
MKIKLSEAGKRFNREWIFRNVSLDFLQITLTQYGTQWFGKSTLLQTIAGMLQLSEGTISYHSGNGTISNDNSYHQISFCAPYLEVIEEMTFIEFIQFHFQFKQCLARSECRRSN